MKKIFKTAAYLAIALSAICCAKAVKVGPNEAEERYFNAWISQNHPGIKPTGLGIYILEEEEGKSRRMDIYMPTTQSQTSKAISVLTPARKQQSSSEHTILPNSMVLKS